MRRARERRGLSVGGAAGIAWLLLVSAVMGGMAGQAAADEPDPLFCAVGPQVPPDETIASGGTIMRRHPVAVDLALLDDCARGERTAVRFNLFDDVVWDGTVTQRNATDPSCYTLAGLLAGSATSSFTLSVKDDVVVGNIRRGTSYCQVRVGGDGFHEIREIDASKFRACATGPGQEMACEQCGGGPLPDPAAVQDDGSVFSVMVVYTEAARLAAGGTTAMEALINLAVAETNTIYANSGITPRIQLAYQQQVSYSEAGGFSMALSHLTGKTDGYMDEVHLLRDAYRADLVSLFIDNSEYCGIAWLMTSLSSSFERYAFSVVAWDCATGYYSFAHEMGHNMGCHHAVGDSGLVQGGGLYDYSHGWRFLGTSSGNPQWRTVMAYAPGTRIDHFSNPDISYDGTATGVPLGSSNEAHNARSINMAASTVANWRSGPVTGLRQAWWPLVPAVIFLVFLLERRRRKRLR